MQILQFYRSFDVLLVGVLTIFIIIYNIEVDKKI